ncbi:unnamed protein product [Phytophthora fragariaefolia]|uniref:Unnamed protein product n=1 Tax=Phytophthora fragariaefolia TaxID=1490495 RepID=A0A9W6XYI9_9STRA|nr:unnamed protein product [Phytophthora fragariaefolia]
MAAGELKGSFLSGTGTFVVILHDSPSNTPESRDVHVHNVFACRVLTSVIFSTSNSPSPSGVSQLSSGSRASSKSRRSDLSVTSCVSGRSGKWRTNFSWDRRFDDIGADAFIAGSGDWLLTLDSDAEGDEDSILHDENDDDPSDDDVMADDSDEESAVERDQVPVRFGLTREDLDGLQAEEWEKTLGGFFTMRRRCMIDRSAQRALLLLMLKTH